MNKKIYIFSLYFSGQKQAVSVDVTSTPSSMGQSSSRPRCGGGAIGSMSKSGSSRSLSSCRIHLVLPTLLALCGLTEARQLLEALVQTATTSLRLNVKVTSNNPIARSRDDTRGRRAYHRVFFANSAGASGGGAAGSGRTSTRSSGCCCVVVVKCRWCSWWWWQSWRRSCGRGSSCGWKKKKRRGVMLLLLSSSITRARTTANLLWTIIKMKKGR